MTKSDARKELHWLQDMREAIEKIQMHEQHAKGKQALDDDEHYRVWVFYHIERIGECASRLRQQFDYDNKHPEIDWGGTVGMRRNLVHWYWSADNEKVWKGVQYLPRIKEKIDEIIKDKERAERTDAEKDNQHPNI